MALLRTLLASEAARGARVAASASAWAGRGVAAGVAVGVAAASPARTLHLSARAMSLKIGFLGGGKMAQALANGFLAKELTRGEDIVASAAPQDKQCFEAFKAMGATATSDNVLVVKQSQVVFISVKPDMVGAVLREVRPAVSADNLFISICMGITVADLESHLPAGTRVVRAMPNTPALVGRGASVYTCGSAARPEDGATAERLLGAVGIAHQVPEKLLDPVTALSGSGPAYVFLVIEALADGAVKEGMPRDLAYQLAAQTVLGAGHLVMETAQHPAKLRDDVTSPGGSTAAGLAHLEKHAVRSAVAGAVAAATRRCKEMQSEKK